MRRFLFLTLLMLALPLTVSAKIVPLINTNGTLTGSDGGLALNSTPTQIYFGYHGADLGALTISLGPLISGSLVTGGTFSSSGSSFVAILNPGVLKGIPPTGTASLSYYGTFNSNGVFTPTMGDGTSLISPEPGTLALLGTGFLALAIIALRSKIRRSNSDAEPRSEP